MNKLLAKFEYRINEKLGLFLLDHDTTIQEAKEMAFAFLKYLGQVEDMAKTPGEVQEKPAEEVVEPPQEVENVE